MQQVTGVHHAFFASRKKELDGQKIEKAKTGIELVSNAAEEVVLISRRGDIIWGQIRTVMSPGPRNCPSKFDFRMDSMVKKTNLQTDVRTNGIRLAKAKEWEFIKFPCQFGSHPEYIAFEDRQSNG